MQKVVPTFYVCLQNYFTIQLLVEITSYTCLVHRYNCLLVSLSIWKIVTLLFFISVPVESAFVNISLSHTNITVNGSLDVTLLGVDPNATTSNLVCSTVASGGAKYEIVYYNFFQKTFVLENPMPADYVGRVKIVSHQEFTVSPIKFTEEKLGVQCRFTYYNNVGTRLNLESSKVTIENVYGIHTF